MSYDLLVFEPLVVPRDRAAFQQWFDDFVRRDGGRAYNDPAICSPSLRAWNADMRRRFWALNGPHASRLGPWLRPDDYGDYVCGPQAIHAGFAWNRAQAADDLALLLARRHRLGLFRVSEDRSVWWPDEE